MTSNLGATALQDDKTVGFGARDIRFDQANMEKRILEGDLPAWYHRSDERWCFTSLSAEDMKEVVQDMKLQPLIRVWQSQGTVANSS